ncbi:MAG: sulfatase-like hydrolase/transferase [Gemmatimonadetes bacterium]|nr:sulfatase-like hydrolase/transferase [Gemmatimonadota bacterium]
MNVLLLRRRALFLLPALLAGCQGQAPRSGDPVAETLVLVTAEGLDAADIGCTGNPEARTPAIDRLARRGVLAREAHAPTDVARIGLATVLTGRAPEDHGLTNIEFSLEENVPTVASLLAERGVDTAAFAGSADADGRHGLGRGFAHHGTFFAEQGRVGEPWREPGFRAAGALATDFTRWLADHTAGPRFVWFHVDQRPVDDAVHAITRELPPDAFVVLTSSDGFEDVALIASGPTVSPRVRAGVTSTEDAASMLCGAFAGADLLADALADVPGDRRVPGVAAESLEPSVTRHLELARAADRRDDVQTALQEYRAACAGEPRLVAARLRAAELARRTGDTEVWIDDASAVLARVPEHPEARVLLARALAARRDEHALSLVAGVLDVTPRHAGALTLRAELDFEGGDPGAAVDRLRLARAAAGENPEDLVDVALGLSHGGLHAEAVRTAQAARRLDEGPRERYTLAFVLEQAERFPESAHEYSSLIRDHPDYLPPYLNLGALMARDGEIERAIALWEQGLERHPDDPSLRANVESARRALGLGTLGG